VRAEASELECALATIPGDYSIFLDFPDAPLALSEDARASIVERAVEVVLAGVSQMLSLVESGVTVRILPGPGQPGLRVFYNQSTDLSAHFQAVEREVVNTVGKKHDGPPSGDASPPAIIVVDVSRLGLAWMRPSVVWAESLGQTILQPVTPFIGLAVIGSDLLSLNVGGAAVLSAGISEDTNRVARQMLDAIGPLLLATQ